MPFDWKGDHCVNEIAMPFDHRVRRHVKEGGVRDDRGAIAALSPCRSDRGPDLSTVRLTAVDARARALII